MDRSNVMLIGDFADSVDIGEMLSLFDDFLSYYGCLVGREYFRPRPAKLLYRCHDNSYLLCYIHAVFTVFPSGIDIMVGEGIKYSPGVRGDLFNFPKDVQPACIFIGKRKTSSQKEKPLLYRYETRGMWRGSIIKASLSAIAWGMEEWLLPTVELESSSAGYILPHAHTQILLVYRGIIDNICISPPEFRRTLTDVLARRVYETL